MYQHRSPFGSGTKVETLHHDSDRAVQDVAADDCGSKLWKKMQGSQAIEFEFVV